MSDVTSRLHDRPPYHCATVTRDHRAFGSASTVLSAGKRFPFSRGRPICPGRRERAGIDPQPGDQAGVAAQGRDQTDAGETGIGGDDQTTIRQPAPGLQDGLPRPDDHYLCRRPRSLLQRWRGQERSGTARPSAGRLTVRIDAEETTLPALTSAGGEPFTPPPPEVVQKRLAAVACAALASEDALDMTDFHRCDTVHCVAGWAIHNEGEAGYALERRVGPHNAGLMLLGVGAASRFYMETEAAREWLRTWLPEAAPR